MYPIILSFTPEFAPGSDAYPGYLYLPGYPVGACDVIGYPDDTLCTACANPMTTRGSRSLTDDSIVSQTPGTGDHDGIVSSFYAPMRGVQRHETDWSHLRCILELCAAGSATLTAGDLDPMTIPVHDTEPRHAA